MNIKNDYSKVENIVRVLAYVNDWISGETESGWALTKLLKNSFALRFLEGKPFFFIPGMPLIFHVFASYSNYHPLVYKELRNLTLEVDFSTLKNSTKSIVIEGSKIFHRKGIAKIEFVQDEKTNNMQIIARLKNQQNVFAKASAMALKFFSPRGNYLYIHTSSFNVLPGQSIIFHVRNNFFIKTFSVMIVSKGIILHVGTEKVIDKNFPSITTFAVPATSDMSPQAKVVIWAFDDKGSFVTHSTFIAINPLSNNKVKAILKKTNSNKIKIKFEGEKELFLMSTLKKNSPIANADHLTNEFNFYKNIFGLENDLFPQSQKSYPEGIAIIPSNDNTMHHFEIVSTSSVRPDTSETFDHAGTYLFTDATIYKFPEKKLKNFLLEGEDEYSSFAKELTNYNRFKYFNLHRQSKRQDLYDIDEDDFGWNITEGNKELELVIPKTSQTWNLFVSVIGKEIGFGIGNENIEIRDLSSFAIKINGPPQARVWEQVGLQITISNNLLKPQNIYLHLPLSSSYEILFLGNTDNFYWFRRSQCAFYHSFRIDGSSSKIINIPVLLKTVGNIEITVHGSTYHEEDSNSMEIKVNPQGAIIKQHTSVLLDLRSTTPLTKYLNIYSNDYIKKNGLKNHLLNEEKVWGHISVTDVISPVLKSQYEKKVKPFEDLSSSFISAETSIFKFASRLWMLHYIRFTNQTSNINIEKFWNVIWEEYSSIISYQWSDGGFCNWEGTEPSVWLTAHVIRNLCMTTFRKIENYIYIDPKIIEEGVNWILTFQTKSGSFLENKPYIHHPLNSKLNPRFRNSWQSKYTYVSLTAYVVLSLKEANDCMNSASLKLNTSIAIKNAIRYLEDHFKAVEDPYDLALVTWTFVNTKSKLENISFQHLDQIKRIAGNRVYWSPEPLGFNNQVYKEKTQVLLLQPKENQKWDSLAVEATAYALLVYLKKQRIGRLHHNIITFLSSMRADTEFTSTLDSLVALEALNQYAYKTGWQDDGDVKIEIEQSELPKNAHQFRFNRHNSLSKRKMFELDPPYGYVKVSGKGRGQALVQLDISYGVTNEEQLDHPPISSFEFRVEAKISPRNNRSLIFTSCQRWLNSEESNTSGLTVVMIQVPSGYYIKEEYLVALTKWKKVQNLLWASQDHTRVQFFFSKVESASSCFIFELDLWFPVSNHSRHNFAVIYDVYQPERFKKLLYEVEELDSLNLCHVCGSFQCPHCPSSSSSLEWKFQTVIFSSLVSKFSYLWHQA